MRFYTLAKYLEKLEGTSKRLEITSILAELLKDLNSEEVQNTVYLILGTLKAPFEDQKFNIADKMMLKILEQTFATATNHITLEKITQMYKEKGDLGDVAAELTNNTEDKVAHNIVDIHEKMLVIAKTEGNGSQETKIRKTSSMLKDLGALSAKYAVRIMLGTTRLGFTELTVIDALAQLVGNKESAEQIEAVYSVHPDIGLIAKKIKAHGLKGISEIDVEVGVPILSQKAQRISGAEEAIEKMGSVFAEFKFDGTRVQLHLDRNKTIKSITSDQTTLFQDDIEKILVKTYTRNLEETTHQYPDVIEAAKKQIKADSIILDGEAIGYNKQTGEFLPFQETIQRKRKHGVAETAKDIPLKYFVFDILYLNGKSLVKLPLRERKEILKGVISEGDTLVVDEYPEVDTAEELQEYFEIASKKGLEGIIAKKTDDAYQAGARSYSWIKLKKADAKLLDDSVDCIVLGYYMGKGVRTEFGIGGFLVGVYDKSTDSFKTISKIGTGLDEEDWKKLKSLCDKNKAKTKPTNVNIEKVYTPDVYVTPKVVVEIGADEISESQTHSAGYALRFPRLLKFREDKNVTEATNLSEIEIMYKKQQRGLY